MFPKRGAIALVTTVLALVLLLSFKTPDPATSLGGATDGAAAVAGATASPTPGTGTSSTTPDSGTTPTVTASPAPTAATTVTGATVPTRFGDVAVQITVEGGRIIDVQAVALPTRGRSGEISDYVAPILASEALQAQSANIDIISGATYTSLAYAKSLQSALDQAGIAAVLAPVG